MNSINFISTIYTVFVSIIIVFILVMILYRIYSVFIRNRPRKSILHSEIGIYVKLLKIGFGISMLLIILIAPIYVYIVSFEFIIPSLFNHALVFVTFCLAALELYMSLSVSDKLLQKKFKKIVLSIVVILILPFSIYMTIFVPALFEFPDEEDSYLVELPVHGTWVAGQAGGSEATNNHNIVRAQQYAIDIVKVDKKGRFYKGDVENIMKYFLLENLSIPR